MQAIVQRAYGTTEVLELRDVERPAPAADEVLLRVRAASVHPDVWHVMTGLPYVVRVMGSGIRRPANPIPGTDAAGVVESVGRDVTRFRPGEPVFGETLRRHQWTNGGAYAEYATAPEEALAPKPGNVTFEEAAAVPTSGLIALGSMRGDRRLLAGRNVLVNGAGGGVGTIALQVFKSFGAIVTGVDATAKLPMLRALGADHVIDASHENFTLRPERYDLVVDIPGNYPLADCRRALEPDGTYIIIGHDDYGRGMRRWLGLMPRMIRLMAMQPFVDQLPEVGQPVPTREDSMALLAELLAAGRLTPHIDRTFPLAEVPAAIRYLQEGHVKGKVVITVGEPSPPGVETPE